jgi:uncharacterized membrane protein
MSALAVSLFVVKMILLHDISLWGINWNLFLSWVPILIVLWMEKKVAINALNDLEVFCLSILWLLFFPNAPYVITDLVHLYPSNGNAYWHHQLMIYTFAFASLACGLMSLYWIQHIWTAIFSAKCSIWLTISSIGLSGYGIFLGRIERFNSWDFFVHPIALLKYMVHSLTNITAILITLEFSVFIGIVYWFFYSLIHLNDK